MVSATIDKTGRPPSEIRSTSLVLVSLSLAVLLSSLGTSIVNVGLPALMTAFASPFGNVQWVVLAYLLAVTCLVVSAGRLGDIVGHRRLLLSGIATFTIASGLCGATSHLWVLLLARAAQGSGAAVMMALGLAFARDVVPKERTGSAMGLLGAMSSIGTTLGPALGGLLISGSGWRAIFLVNLPLGGLTFLLAFLCLPAQSNSPQKSRSSFDIWGTLVLALSLAAYALAMTGGLGPSSNSVEALVAVAVGGGALFLLVERWVASPLVPLSLLHDLRLCIGLLMSACVATVMMATLVVGPFYLSRGIGLNAFHVGLAMAVGPLVAAIAAAPAGRLADRFGATSVTIAGLVGLLLGTTLIATLATRHRIELYIAPLCVVSIGYGLFQTANNTLLMASANPQERGVTSGLINLSRNFGLISGAAVMGAIFATATKSSDITHATQQALDNGVAFTFQISAVLSFFAVLAAFYLWRISSVASHGND